MLINKAKCWMRMAAVGLAALCAGNQAWALQFGSAPVVSTTAIPQTGLISPEQLIAAMQKNRQEAPLVIQVGSRMMFDQGRIPAAVFAGPAVQPEGIDLLRNRVASLPRSKFIVIYCGCCPWSRCPNIGTAYQFLLGMGFKNLKALYLPNNFGMDWVAKGYKVEK